MQIQKGVRLGCKEENFFPLRLPPKSGKPDFFRLFFWQLCISCILNWDEPLCIYFFIPWIQWMKFRYLLLHLCYLNIKGNIIFTLSSIQRQHCFNTNSLLFTNTPILKGDNSINMGTHLSPFTICIFLLTCKYFKVYYGWKHMFFFSFG